MATKIFIDSTGHVSLASLKNKVTDTYINDATVTFSAYPHNDRTTAVSGISGIAMPSTGGTGGYRGVLTATMSLNLTKGSRYWIKVVAVSGTSKKTLWKLFLAELDQGDC